MLIECVKHYASNQTCPKIKNATHKLAIYIHNNLLFALDDMIFDDILAVKDFMDENNEFFSESSNQKIEEFLLTTDFEDAIKEVHDDDEGSIHDACSTLKILYRYYPTHLDPDHIDDIENSLIAACEKKKYRGDPNEWKDSYTKPLYNDDTNITDDMIHSKFSTLIS